MRRSPSCGWWAPRNSSSAAPSTSRACSRACSAGWWRAARCGASTSSCTPGGAARSSRLSSSSTSSSLRRWASSSSSAARPASSAPWRRCGGRRCRSRPFAFASRALSCWVVTEDGDWPLSRLPATAALDLRPGFSHQAGKGRPLPQLSCPVLLIRSHQFPVRLDDNGTEILHRFPPRSAARTKIDLEEACHAVRPIRFEQNLHRLAKDETGSERPQREHDTAGIIEEQLIGCVKVGGYFREPLGRSIDKPHGLVRGGLLPSPTPHFSPLVRCILPHNLPDDFDRPRRKEA